MTNEEDSKYCEQRWSNRYKELIKAWVFAQQSKYNKEREKHYQVAWLRSEGV